MNLSLQLDTMKREMLPKIRPEDLGAIRASVEKNVRDGVAANSYQVGDAIPEFSLINHRGESLDISEKLTQGPLVISFYRGGWCPYCNLELKALQETLPEIKAQGGQLIAISPELPDESLSTVEKNNLDFEVLSDPGNRVARKFGLVFSLAEATRPVYQRFGIELNKVNGDESWELPIPATYVVGQNGTITLAYVDPDFTKRLEPSEIVKALQI